jgi:hypothetical protein
MADREFTPQDVAGLAAKLESLDLTEAERALLAAIVSHGADAVAAHHTPAATSSVPDADVDIREELAAAFAPAPQARRRPDRLGRISIGPRP